MTPEHMKTTPEDIDLDRMKDDTISRQAVLKLLSAMPPEEATTKAILIQSVQQMNSAQLEVAKDANVLTNDCISRQEAIDALRTHDRKASKKWFDNQLDIEWNNAIDICCYDIEDLPSVQPERIKGHWVEIASSNHTYKCSVCGRLLVNITDGKNNVAKNYPYCHCGADMRGEQDG